MSFHSKYNSSNSALNMMCIIIENAIDCLLPGRRILEISYWTNSIDIHCEAMIMVGPIKLDSPPASTFPDLIETARLLTEKAANADLLGTFKITAPGKLYPAQHYCKISFKADMPRDELKQELQKLYDSCRQAAQPSPSPQIEEIDFAGDGITKLLFMAINLAIRDKVKQLTLVHMKNYKDDKEGGIRIVIDHEFMVPPPAHLWPQLSSALAILCKIAKENNLVGEFAWRLGPNEPLKVGQAPIAARWDIYFSPNPRRNLGSELITLFQQSEHLMRQKLAEIRTRETNSGH